ncbi:UDP-N-acetylglucosamine 1-carboxyvinyltransferase [Patescibacteria group bacterium]|nr:UDP-N-acetylglucosamine 1-carboxyvinyltransferase [Patescibacteria group bacterium]MCL5409322.1 UDP-N-acetylglucosamine 1-carboxyvinyltransferase [Patescibacteria group bacterium]
MAKYIITGGKKLRGSIKLSGNKNSILPCLAASLLTDEEVVLKNTPQIADVNTFLTILEYLGVQVQLGDHQIVLNSSKVVGKTLPENLMHRLRASILVIGPLLSRFGQAEFYHPGGDVIGKRSIDVHLEGLVHLGYKFTRVDRHYLVKSNSLKSSEITVFLEEASVTATENLILSSVIGERQVTLKNCAKEPHIVDLCKMLNKMGANIVGVGESTLQITGVKKLHKVDFTISADHVEFGTYAIAAAVTGGEIEIENKNLPELDPIMIILEKMGINFSKNEQRIRVTATQLKPIAHLKTNIWPGFPTDLMSVIIVLATQAKGVSLCHDWMFESRMFFVDKLITMGANITIADPHRVLIYGPTELHSRILETPDIRAGMALVLSSLIAKGQSVIEKAELIERGYEDVTGKLINLGADITKEA